MAEKILNTRILMKVDTLENWNKSTLKLKKGELAFATLAASAGAGLEEPVVMVKIGTEEEKTFSELPWAFHAKASDVLTACKTEAGLTAFVKGVLTAEGVASDSVVSALTNRVTTAEGEIDTLQGEMDAVEKKAADNTAAIEAIEAKFGADTVALEIEAAIKALKLADTYAAKTHGHVIADVEGLADSIADAKKAGTDAAEALGEYKTLNDAAVKVNSDAIAAIKKDATITTFKGVEEALAGKEASGAAAQALVDAKAYADGLADNYDAKGAAAAAESAAKAYADGLAGNYDAAGSASAAETAAKAYTDSEMTRLVGDTKVSDQIATQITNLDLPNTYAAKSHKHVKADITDFAHTHEMGEVNGLVDALAGKEVAGAAAAALVEAKSYADGKDAAIAAAKKAGDDAQKEVDALELLVGTLPEGATATDIVGYVQEKTSGIATEGAMTELGNRVGVVEGKVATIEADYLKAADKTELQNAIDALEELVGDEKVSEAIDAAVLVETNRAKGEEARIAGLVSAEETRAKGVEAGLEERLVEVETFFKTAEGETIDQALDTLVEIQKYLDGEGEVADQMLLDIAANKKAIEDHAATDHDFAAADAALKSELNAEIVKKAAQTDLESAVGRIDTVEGKVSTLEGEMDSAEGRLDALEELVGDDKVSEAIDAAIEALKIGDYAKAADLTAAVNRVTAAEGKITTLEGKMTTAEGKISTLETEVAKKANDADLAAIAKTGNVNDLVQTAGDVLIFDCGTSV